ncbi:MAG TPA: hypothetical protein VFW73_02975, partial [Lacipirellulaceae bacterium]|nr:hypothetical protein [Lacipirellulaceae bacterium]
ALRSGAPVSLNPSSTASGVEPSANSKSGVTSTFQTQLPDWMPPGVTDNTGCAKVGDAKIHSNVASARLLQFISALHSNKKNDEIRKTIGDYAAAVSNVNHFAGVIFRIVAAELGAKRRILLEYARQCRSSPRRAVGVKLEPICQN